MIEKGVGKIYHVSADGSCLDIDGTSIAIDLGDYSDPFAIGAVRLEYRPRYYRADFFVIAVDLHNTFSGATSFCFNSFDGFCLARLCPSPVAYIQWLFSIFLSYV